MTGGRRCLLQFKIDSHAYIVRFLLERGANAHASLADGTTTLMMAVAEATNRDIMWLVLNADVDIEARDNSQRTALHHAADAFFAFFEVVRELIEEHNADMFAVDEGGDTPFDVATRSVRATTSQSHTSLWLLRTLSMQSPIVSVGY